MTTHATRWKLNTDVEECVNSRDVVFRRRDSCFSFSYGVLLCRTVPCSAWPAKRHTIFTHASKRTANGEKEGQRMTVLLLATRTYRDQRRKRDEKGEREK